jgi:hypothetical protein
MDGENRLPGFAQIRRLIERQDVELDRSRPFHATILPDYFLPGFLRPHHQHPSTVSCPRSLGRIPTNKPTSAAS